MANDFELLDPAEVDRILQVPDGRARQLADRGILPHVRLPDGEIRFERAELRAVIEQGRRPANISAVRQGVR